MKRKSLNAVFIGNFVQDTVITSDGLKTYALGGSVTYGPLAASALCKKVPQDIQIQVISCLGNDLTPENQQFLLSRFEQSGNIFIKTIAAPATTAYKLLYDENNCRTLSLQEKGSSIKIDHVIEHLGCNDPSVLFFVPVAAEFDEELLIQVVNYCNTVKKCFPLVAIDIQGFIRTFDGKKVMTRDAQQMTQKLQKCGKYISFLKAEFSEANEIVGKHLTPSQCAIELCTQFDIENVAVTMGKGGSFLCSMNRATKESYCVYVPANAPVQTVDETGCGDCFLACTMMEMILNDGNVIEAVRMGSAATSFRVESRGPHGFKSREEVMERVHNGKLIESEFLKLRSTTKYNVDVPKKPKIQQL